MQTQKPKLDLYEVRTGESLLYSKGLNLSSSRSSSMHSLIVVGSCVICRKLTHGVLISSLCLPHTASCWTAHKANPSSAKGPTGNSQYEPGTYFINVCWYLWCGGSVSVWANCRADRVIKSALVYTYFTPSKQHRHDKRQEDGKSIEWERAEEELSGVQYWTKEETNITFKQTPFWHMAGVKSTKAALSNTNIYLAWQGQTKYQLCEDVSFCPGKPNHVRKSIHLFLCAFPSTSG